MSKVLRGETRREEKLDMLRESPNERAEGESARTSNCSGLQRHSSSFSSPSSELSERLRLSPHRTYDTVRRRTVHLELEHRHVAREGPRRSDRAGSSLIFLLQ